jgi:chorismate mutase
MSKFINITVSASLSTDFLIEVGDNATEEEILEAAKKEVTLPHMYPEVLDKVLKEQMGITVNGIDSLLRSWNIDEVNYIIGQ